MNAEKVCLIAGGSSGIGAEIARHLASLGYGNLAIAARRKEKLEEVRAGVMLLLAIYD